MASPIAYSPASITCIFSPREVHAPEKASSPGIAINLDRGVAAGITTGNRNRAHLNGEEVLIPALEKVMRTMAPETISVHLESDLPLGSGFGISACCALSAALAIDQRFSLGFTPEGMAMIAHDAEVRSGSGLGDVASQITGGVARRTCVSGPLDAVALATDVTRLGIRHFGPLQTKDVLRDPDQVKVLAREGAQALAVIDRLENPVSMHAILDTSLGFARASGLVTDERVAGCIEDVKAKGESATMVMLGHVVLATATTELGSDWLICGVDHEGARVL